VPSGYDTGAVLKENGSFEVFEINFDDRRLSMSVSA
jgi:hypothetical protein